MRRRLSRAGDTPLRRWRRIILALLGGLLAVQALTLALFAVSTWRATNSQSDAFIEQAVSAASVSASEKIEELVLGFESTVNLSTRLIEQRVIPGGMDAETERYLLQSLRTNPVQSAAYLGFGNGEFLMVSRDATTPGFAYRVKQVRTQGGARTVTLRWFDESLTSGVTTTDPTDTFDPRSRPWYRAAIAQTSVVWTDPYVFFSSRQPGLTVARQTASSDGVARVFGADFSVEKLGEFARAIRVGPRGATLIVAGDGSVIAAPGLASKITVDGKGQPVLPKLAAFDDPIAALAPALVGAAVAGPRVRVESGGNRTEAAVSKVRVGDRQWTIALYGPASDFASSVADAGRRGVIKIILLGVAALCLAVFLAAALTRPLGGLASTAASDGLTGLANRREVEAVGRVLFERAQAGSRMLSIAIVDVDSFKQINDTHGHMAGDDVLRAVADLLADTVRSEDVVARFAGDEFVVVMPDAGGPEAEAVTRRALQRIREQPLPGPVTVSAGVATLGKQHANFDQLLETADRALYRAKTGGRDRVARDADSPHAQ